MSNAATQPTPPSVRAIAILGWLLCLLFLAAGVIWDRTAGTPLRERPILLVLSLYVGAFVVAMASLRVALRSERSRRLVPTIVIFAISFRLIQLFSMPFLEIDAYRYMWDGITTGHGISPYAWSPSQARAESEVGPEQRLVVDLANSSESVHRIVSKVHYPKYTSIYPPVSQTVFAVTMWLVPDSASVRTHLSSMKSALVCFDLATLFLLLKCLNLAGRNPGWIVAYAWNPLVIKEIANSGHLDSIAVFFVTAAVFIVMRETRRDAGFRLPIGVLCGVLLSLAIGSKLYPVVLVPLVAVWIWRRDRMSAVGFALTVPLVATLVLAPMLLATPGNPSESRDGLSGFLSRWRMNGLAYEALYQNARLPARKPDLWYSVVSNDVRRSWHRVSQRLPGSLPPETQFARGITLGLFGLLYFWVLIGSRQSDDPEVLARAAFYVLTSFLLLQPTLNPWYWVWVVPFVCFVRNIGWHMVGACLLLYYARFWFRFSGVDISLGGTVYTNVECFDHIVVWVEHALFVVGVVAFRYVEVEAHAPGPTISNVE